MRKLLITLGMGALSPTAGGARQRLARGARRQSMFGQALSVAGRCLWAAVRWYWTRLSLVGMLVWTLLLVGGAPIVISQLPMVPAHQKHEVLALTDLILFLNMAGAVIARAGRGTP